MTTRENTVCEITPDTEQRITGVGRAPLRRKIRHFGRVPLTVFGDPRLLEVSAAAFAVLLVAHLRARSDDSQRVNGEAAKATGWLLTAEGTPYTLRRLASHTHCSVQAVSRGLDDLLAVGVLTLSDTLVWGVLDWESDSAPRVRRHRAQMRQPAAVAEPDFFPFGKDGANAPAATVRPTAAARKKVGPKSLGNDDAAIAERDNRRPMGRT